MLSMSYKKNQVDSSQLNSENYIQSENQTETTSSKRKPYDLNETSFTANLRFRPLKMIMTLI